MIQEDFEQHVVKLQNALLGFAKSLTHNEDEAKDLLQETSLKALSNKAMYDDSGSIKSWLYTIMRNLFLNCRRHSSRQESLPTDFEIPDTDDMQGGIEGEDSFSTIDVQRIMDLLSIDNRILFRLFKSGSQKSLLNIGPASHTAGPTTAFAFYIVVGDTASSFLDRFFHLPETIGDS